MNSVTHKSHSRCYFGGLIQIPRNVFCYCQTCKICCHFILVYCHCQLRTTFRKCKEQNICYNHYPQIIQVSSFSWIYNLLIQIKILEHCSPNTICPKKRLSKCFHNSILHGTLFLLKSCNCFQQLMFQQPFYILLMHRFINSCQIISQVSNSLCMEGLCSP